MAGDRVAILVPGRAYPADAPLLMYAGLAASRGGSAVWPMSWAVPAVPDDNALRAWVIAQVARALEEAGQAASGESPAACAGRPGR
ncbi:MAG TPA: hypothetical protein VG253_21730 [Streptosporangiaceae bacterium]|nr:hypothetical protein [Streptosporangiaceae bacterium]